MANIASQIGDLRALEELFSLHGDAVFDTAYDRANEAISQGFGRNIDAALSENGTPFPPRVDNKPHPLLKLTLKMYNAASDPLDPGHYYERLGANGERVAFGVDDNEVHYAKYHVTGTRKMPARNFIYADEFTEAEIERVFIDEMNVKLNLYRRKYVPKSLRPPS